MCVCTYTHVYIYIYIQKSVFLGARQPLGQKALASQHGVLGRQLESKYFGSGDGPTAYDTAIRGAKSLAQGVY